MADGKGSLPASRRLVFVGMQPPAYLHVGLPKTGTTHLQLKLWHHEKALEAEGVMLPLDGKRAHFLAALDLVGGKKQGVAWADLAADVDAHDGPVVISQELLASATKEQAATAVASLSGTHDVHLVMTVRDLSRQIPSAWQQLVRYRVSDSLDQYMNAVLTEPQHEFWVSGYAPRVIERWLPSLSPERVHIITVPGADPSLLWQRFASVIGVDPGEPGERLIGSNASMGAAQTEMLRRWNAQLDPAQFPTHDPYMVACRTVLLPSIPRTPAVPFGLPAQWADWLTATTDDLCRELSGHGFDIRGDLAELEPDLTPLMTPQDLSDKEVLQVALATMTELVSAQLRLRKELEASRAKIERLKRRKRAQARPKSRSVGIASRVRRALLRDSSGRQPGAPS